MEKITGVAAIQPRTLKKQGDLLYHEGPLLSHFVDEQDAKTHYLYKWTDCDESANRWLVIAVPENMLLDYFSRKVSLRQLINYSPQLSLVDINGNLEEATPLECTFENIPTAYLPGENSFYDERKCEPYAQQLKDAIIAGRQLDYSLLAKSLDDDRMFVLDWSSNDFTTLSHEIFDTLLSGYSKKKVYDFLTRHYLDHFSPRFADTNSLPTCDVKLVSKYFIILVEIKDNSGFKRPTPWSLKKELSTFSTSLFKRQDIHLGDLDTELLHYIQASSEPTTRASGIANIVRQYMYESALKDDFVDNLL